MVPKRLNLNSNLQTKLKLFIEERSKNILITFYCAHFKNVIKLFSSESIASQIINYDRIQSEFLILAYHCKNIYNLLEIFKISESLKYISLNVNKMLRLVYTAPFKDSI